MTLYITGKLDKNEEWGGEGVTNVLRMVRIFLKSSAHETHFIRNKSCGGDETNMFCTNEHGAQISGVI